MVRALLDTNILIDFLSGVPEARDEIARHAEPAISAVTWMEVMVGATLANEAGMRAFLANFEVVPIDQAVAEAAVVIRRTNRIKLPDAIIWASARNRGMLLVTRNSRDFDPADPGVRIPYVTG